MKKEKADLEQLLNSLIEKGWKPRGENVELYLTSKNTFWEKIVIFIGNASWFKKWWWTYRELVSKESWLWQFVCENGMVNEKHKHERILDPTFWEWWADCKRQEHDWNYWYRLIESALLDEDKLEDFLLSNIKVEW